MIIDGKKIAEEIISNLKNQPKPEKFLAAVLVGEDPALVSFVKQKESVAKKLGIDFRLYKFLPELKNDDLRKEVLKIAQHRTCGGVIVQLPLPEHVNRHYVLNVIPREKDVDVLGERALGAFYVGRNPVLPPAVGVVEKIFEVLNVNYGELAAAVVGAGFLTGKPVATWLTGKCKEVFILDKGSDFSLLKNAEVVISGVGKAGIIKPEMLKDGAGVIDFGYSAFGGKVSGDFDVSGLETINSELRVNFYTPTPGGTGPILVAKLFENFYKLNEE